VSWRGAGSLLGRHLRVYRRRAGSALAMDLALPAACLLGLGLASAGGVAPARHAAGLLVAAAALVAALEGSLGAHRRLRAGPVGESALASPLGLPELLAAELLFAALRAGLCAGLLAAIAGGLGWLGGGELARSLAFGVLGGLAMASLALWTTALARGPEDLRAFLAGVVLPCLALSGAWFPLEARPPWGRALLWLSPLFRASAGAGAHGPAEEPAWLLLHLAVLVAFAALPLWATARALRRALAA